MAIESAINPYIELQPKQGLVFDLMEANQSTWIGAGGGRGGAKSRCIQSVMLARRLAWPGTVGSIVMRNSDQVRKYHEDPMLRAWPQLNDFYYRVKRKIVIPFRDGPPSEIQFDYAETLEDVIRRFRSANLFDIAIDQAEQFSEEELREIKQAVRWPDVPEGTCKILLAFNMGGVGIDFLRKKFHSYEYNERESKKDFSFVHFFPYDNVEWSKPALKIDGLTVDDYYSWSSERREEYCARRSDYGKALVSQDEALVKRDWNGSWESLEGAYFGRSFDRNSTVLTPEAIDAMIKPWWEHWISQDWARGHYCITYWHASGEMSPREAKEILGWDVPLGIKMVVTYREYVAGGEAAPDQGGRRELDEDDIAREIVERTPSRDRPQMQDFFLSPDAFGKKSNANTVAESEGAILNAAGMPYPRHANDERVNGWSLMSRLLLASKRRGQKSDTAWVISANCPELVSAIPIQMRDPKKLEDIIKTDKSSAKIDQDAMDSARYGLKSKLEPGQAPEEEKVRQTLLEYQEAGMDAHSLAIHTIRLNRDLNKPEPEVRLGRKHGIVRIGR